MTEAHLHAVEIEHDDPAPDTGTSSAEERFWTARPFLERTHQFAKARRVSPYALLGVTLARIITATPNQLTLPPLVGSKASLNMFVGLVGGSGGGKGAAEGAARDFLKLHVNTARIASGEAIAHVYKKRDKQEVVWRDDDHAALIDIPEIDRLAGQHARQGSTILADLRSAWSGEALGQVAADSSRSITLEAHQYRLCLIAGIQPTRAGVLLDDVDGGTPQRFLWLPVHDHDAPETPPELPAPITWSPPRLSVTGSYQGTHMGVCDLATTTIDRARLDRLRGEGDALDGHALLCQLKTAAGLALADDRLHITDTDWHLAGHLARVSTSVRRRIIADIDAKKVKATEARARDEAQRAIFVERSKDEDRIHRVCGVIQRRLDRAPATPSELRKAIASRDRSYFETAVDRLIAAGQIDLDPTKTGHGNTTGEYFRKDRS